MVAPVPVHCFSITFGVMCRRLHLNETPLMGLAPTQFVSTEWNAMCCGARSCITSQPGMHHNQMPRDGKTIPYLAVRTMTKRGKSGEKNVQKKLSNRDRTCTNRDTTRKDNQEIYMPLVQQRSASKFCYGLLSTVTFCCVHTVLVSHIISFYPHPHYHGKCFDSLEIYRGF